MKKLSIGFLLICFYSYNLYGQLFKDSFDWEKYSIKIENQKKIHEILKIDHWLIALLEDYPSNYLENDEVLERFRLYDFSGDGNLDIIYYGPSGAEPFITLFLQKVDDVYIESLSFYGRPIDIIKPVPNYPAVIKMLESSNSFDSLYSIQLFIPSIDENILSYSLSSKLNFHEGTFFPGNYSITKRFEIINELYNVRSTPFISDNNFDNVVAIAKSGTQGFAISSKIDETGREWFFVLIHSDENLTESKIYSGINNDEEFYILGWLSTRFIKIFD